MGNCFGNYEVLHIQTVIAALFQSPPLNVASSRAAGPASVGAGKRWGMALPCLSSALLVPGLKAVLHILGRLLLSQQEPVPFPPGFRIDVVPPLS